MPNRILKESICSSDNLASLPFEAEAFFYRLMVQCDDFGRMDARSSVLRARCYQVQLDAVDADDIAKWLQELIDADLVWLYESDGKRYLQMTNWDKHQQRRAQYSKYPDPLAEGSHRLQMISDGISCAVNTRSEEPRHEEPRSEEREGDGKKQPSKPKPDPRVKEMVVEFQGVLGYDVPAFGAEATAAKWLVNHDH